MKSKSSNSVRVGAATITYEVTRSERRKKTIQTLVSADRVRVLAPADASDRELEDLVREQAPWILDRRESLRSGPAPKRFVTGETMPYLGQDFELVVNTDDFLRPWVRFEGGRFRFDAPPGLDRRERAKLIRNAFADWYRTEAAGHLPERVEHWAPLVAPTSDPAVLIRDQRSRWGSCSRDGTLRFNWRLMMLAPDLVDYVVVHELTHLMVMNHSPFFWECMTRVMPDVTDRRRRLREAGRRLPL